MSITINTKVCHSWVFDDKEEEEAKVCEALSNLAIKTGISDKFNAVLSAKGILNRPGRKANAAKTASNLQSFWLYDLAFNYKANKNINTFIKINNLFDKFYTDQMYDMNPDGSWYSAQGRNIQVGVEYKF